MRMQEYGRYPDRSKARPNQPSPKNSVTSAPIDYRLTVPVPLFTIKIAHCVCIFFVEFFWCHVATLEIRLPPRHRVLKREQLSKFLLTLSSKCPQARCPSLPSRVLPALRKRQVVYARPTSSGGLSSYARASASCRAGKPACTQLRGSTGSTCLSLRCWSHCLWTQTPSTGAGEKQARAVVGCRARPGGSLLKNWSSF
eukprot:SAG31_NODE_1382_length_8579_cov_25.152830_3_plen_198_part_00